MDVSRDYEDLFKTLNTYKIKYLVVGAYAVMYYSEPRFTKDIDIWIIPDINDINILGIAELIKAKKKAGRLQDKLDVERLIKIKKK